MPNQYEIGRSDEGPSKDNRWSFLWKAVIEAFDEGYRGWVSVSLPNHKETLNAAGSLYHRRRRCKKSVEVRYRKQKDGTYILFARLLEKEEM